MAEAWQVERMAVDENGKTSNTRTWGALKGQRKEGEGHRTLEKGGTCRGRHLNKTTVPY